jgi:hypothetical protein
MRRHCVFLTLLLTAVLAASCSSKSTNTATTTVPASTSTSAATTSTSATSGSGNTGLQARAAAAGLQASDFPAGWQAQDAQGSNLNLDTTWQAILSCTGVSDQPMATATSPTYLRGQATQAQTTVEYTSASSAAALAAAVAGPKFQGCLTDAFNAAAKSNAPPGAPAPPPVMISSLTAPAVGQKAYATRINVTMMAPGLTINIFQDFLVIFNGATVMRMLFLNPGSAFPPDLEQTLVTNVVNRAGTS